MKNSLFGAAVAIVACLCLHTSQAAVTILDPTYSAGIYHSHSVTTSAIVSFDWDSTGAVYYQTSTSAFTFGGLYRWNGATQTTAVGPIETDYSGASVVAIGNYVYFNTSDFSTQNISKYGPLGGSPSSALISTAPNSGLYRRGAGEIFITGAPGFGTNEIYYASLSASGDFLSTPISLGLTSGGSGPIAFDAAGNMYYAPGFGDLSIYRYTAADVAAAIADPTNSPLPTAGSRLWYNYSGDFALVSGGTGMAFDGDGNLLLTLTDFSNPSYLVRFDVDISGNHAGNTALLSSTDRLGDVRFYDGSIFVANGNTILQVIPEPGTWLLLALGCTGIVVVWSRRRATRSHCA